MLVMAVTTRLHLHLTKRAKFLGCSLRDIYAEAGKAAFAEVDDERAFWRSYGQVVRLRGPRIADRGLLVALAEIVGDSPDALLWLATRDAWARDGWDGPLNENDKETEG